MRILITGFDAFDTTDVNPSQQAVERLNEGLLRSAGVAEAVIAKTHTLATCCNEAWCTVQAEVSALAAGGEEFAVLMTGFAGNRNKICLERFALNTRAYRIDDNQGHKWQEEYLDEKAPDAIRCKLPLFELMESLNGSGFQADISNYAGTFVCNETYFRTLQKWQDDPNCRGIIFIHVPDPIDYTGTNPDQKVPETSQEIEGIREKALDEYARAFAHIVKFITENETVKNKNKQQQQTVAKN
jgi:pyroglutamyl-peptidase